MENSQQISSSGRPWFLEALPILVTLLIAAHVFALVYWIYKLAFEKQSPRKKAH